MADLEQLATDLSALTLLEASELTKILEEKWGVSAAAPMAMGMMPGMAAGGAVEEAEEQTEFDVILKEAKHPYTCGLLNCIIPLDQEIEKLKTISGLPPDPANFPSGCKFHPRCDLAKGLCLEERPALREVKPGHFVRCHLSI